ncbi:MAG: cyclic nucleotide-binding domain-containing protein [Deltaproteobacteria bacterium]|nr:cyclic nucleotide-binding domain-containing protein [Deltaproteobacteria bacterium]
MPKSPTPQEELDSLVRVAKSFSQRQLYAEAADLFRLALQLDPKNAGLRISLAEMLRMQRQYSDAAPKTRKDALQEQFRRDSIDSAHFLGLAEFYAGKGETARALSCLDMSKAKNAVNPALLKLHGKILARHKDFGGAARELAQALRYNPFDGELAETLGRIEYERRDFKASLDAAIQAYLLLNDGDSEGAERLRKRIRTLKQILGFEHADLVGRFRAGREQLQVAFDRLQWHRDLFLEQGGLAESDLTSSAQSSPPGTGLIGLAGKIQKLGAFPNLSDPQIIQVAQAAEEEFHDRGLRIFRHGTVEDDLYLLTSGEVSFQRTTSYGVFEVRKLGPGSLFGEANFISHLERTGDTLTLEPTRVLRFRAEALRQVIAEDAELGVRLYWIFWHTLARKLRATNEQLRTFFSSDATSADPSQLRHEHPEAALRVKIDSNDKIRVLQEQGLSHSELMTLATFSREKRFEPGSFIFQEGDEGGEMYVILEGKARISKFISGAGEEALAILERGDFFGEMSLIDGQPRSADARAHDGPVTVLALERATFHEILSMDAHASLELLQLLCRLIALRLREMNSKLVGWSILAGPRSDDDSVDPSPWGQATSRG